MSIFSERNHPGMHGLNSIVPRRRQKLLRFLAEKMIRTLDAGTPPIIAHLFCIFPFSVFASFVMGFAIFEQRYQDSR